MSQVILGISYPLLGGFAIPHDRRGLILIDSFAIEVTFTKIGLGISRALIGSLPEPCSRLEEIGPKTTSIS